MNGATLKQIDNVVETTLKILEKRSESRSKSRIKAADENRSKSRSRPTTNCSTEAAFTVTAVEVKVVSKWRSFNGMKNQLAVRVVRGRLRVQTKATSKNNHREARAVVRVADPVVAEEIIVRTTVVDPLLLVGDALYVDLARKKENDKDGRKSRSKSRSKGQRREVNVKKARVNENVPYQRSTIEI